ncbi:hypothetical protein H0X06_05645 [Candidatus Dependentiae bacterium]|nr:hypothetical protein [Candidatus Dependentiae bacterium]
MSSITSLHKSRKINAHKESIFTLALNQYGEKIILTGFTDKIACSWDASTGKNLNEVMRKQPISSVALSPIGKLCLQDLLEENSSIGLPPIESLSDPVKNAVLAIAKEWNNATSFLFSQRTLARAIIRHYMGFFIAPESDAFTDSLFLIIETLQKCAAINQRVNLLVFFT